MIKRIFATLAASVLLVSTGWSQDPTTVFTWNGQGADAFMQTAANWLDGVAPAPLSSNVLVFQALPTFKNPVVDTNYGTTIIIYSNNLPKTQIYAGYGNQMNLGSYVQQNTAASACYFGVLGTGAGYVNFTNALGDASVGGKTTFMCNSNRLDVYGVLIDGAGAHSKLIKTGNATLGLTGTDANLYTGGTIVSNAGPIKMFKPAGMFAIPGDVTLYDTSSLADNVAGGDQIAHNAVVTLNDSAAFNGLRGQPYTVQTAQSTSASTLIALGGGTLTVAPSSATTYNGGTGESDFYGSITDNGAGTVVMNGTGTYGMLGVNAAANLTVNSGTLKVNGCTGTGVVTVNAGGTLLGTGTIAGAVTIASGGSIGSGFSTGSLTLGAGLDLSAGGTNVWELAALKDNATGVAGTDFDQVVLTGGNLVLDGSSTLVIRLIGAAAASDVTNPFWQSSHTWTIISMNGGSNPGASNFATVQNGNGSAGNFTTAPDGSGNILLTFTPHALPVLTRARITSVTSAGPGSKTVSYTNTLAGTAYTLMYNTNLGNTANWYPAGTKTAAGTSDSQTDSSATTSERFYRVYHP